MNVITEAYLNDIGVNDEDKIPSAQVLEAFGGTTLYSSEKICLKILLEGEEQYQDIIFQIDPNTTFKSAVFGQSILRPENADLDMMVWDKSARLSSGSVRPRNSLFSNMVAPLYTKIKDHYKSSTKTYKQTEVLERYSVPYVNIETNGKLLQAMIDTGSPRTCMDWELVKRMNLENQLMKPTIFMSGAAGSVPVKGELFLKIKLQRQDSPDYREVSHRVIVVDGGEDDFLIGLDFFREHNLVHSNSLDCMSGPNKVKYNKYQYNRDMNIKNKYANMESYIKFNENIFHKASNWLNNKSHINHYNKYKDDVLDVLIKARQNLNEYNKIKQTINYEYNQIKKVITSDMATQTDIVIDLPQILNETKHTENINELNKIDTNLINKQILNNNNFIEYSTKLHNSILLSPEVQQQNHCKLQNTENILQFDHNYHPISNIKDTESLQILNYESKRDNNNSKITKKVIYKTPKERYPKFNNYVRFNPEILPDDEDIKRENKDDYKIQKSSQRRKEDHPQINLQNTNTKIR